ncbi:MAG: Kae1-associated kinase Bud32 [Thermoprotei archaeon]
MNSIEFLKELKLVAKGAEAELWLGEFLGQQVVIKKRIRKLYRDPLLDAKLRLVRTMEEGRLLARSSSAGVNVPFPFFIDPLSYTLIEQVLNGPLLRDIDPIDVGLMKKVGFEVAKLHLSGVVHGDLTTSNVIVLSGTDPFIIDFGLGAFSADLEDRGVDLLLLKKSLEANLPNQSYDLFSSFYEGYKEILGADAAQILARSQEIERRGRYFAERSFD